MLPFRNSSRSREPRQNHGRVFPGRPLGIPSNGTYARAFLSPMASPMIAMQENQMMAWTGANNSANLAEMRRACGLPEPIADFILNVSFDDLNETTNDTNGSNQQLVPSGGAVSPITNDEEEEDQEHHVFWPSTLRPRAMIDQDAKPIVPSSSREMVLWHQKPELATLPWEIRQIILRKLLEPSASTTTTIPDHSPDATAHLVVPVTTGAVLEDQSGTLRGAKSLLQASKQLRSEFLPLFSARYSYTLTSTRDLLYLALPRRPLSSSALSLTWTHLRHVELSVDATVQDEPRSRAFLQLCCLAIYVLPRLETLTIVHLPAAFSPVRFYAGADPAAMAVYDCTSLLRYGQGSSSVGGAVTTSDDFVSDVWALPGWGVRFFRVGEMLQEWMRRTEGAEFRLFGHVYRTLGRREGAMALTLQTDGKWRKARKAPRKEEAEQQQQSSVQ